jgi:hypothetical protein
MIAQKREMTNSLTLSPGRAVQVLPMLLGIGNQQRGGAVVDLLDRSECQDEFSQEWLDDFTPSK